MSENEPMRRGLKLGLGKGEKNAPQSPPPKLSKEENRAALKWITHVAKPELPRIILIVLGEALWATFGTVTALFTREIVNAATSGDAKRMWTFIIIFVITSLSLLGVNALMRYVTDKCQAKLEIRFRHEIFDKILSRSYPALSAYHTGDIVNRLSGDVGVITGAATSILPQIVMMAVRLIAAMVVLVQMEWRFALIFTVGGIVILLVSRFLKPKVQRYHKEMQEAYGKTHSFWQEIFENLSVIKAFASEDKSVERSDKLMNDHFKIRMRRSVLGVLSMMSTRFIIRIGHLFAVGYGAVKMLNDLGVAGGFTFGDFSALTQLVNQVQMPFANMSGIMPQYYSALASASRLMEMEKLASDSIEGERADAEKTYAAMKRIDVKHIDFSYDRENPVLVDSSCTVEMGDFISITGMSGIGKSTLFKVLLDIYPKTAGKAEIITDGDPIPLSGLTRTLFAYVPQGNMLFSGTIRENLMFLADENAGETQIREALEAACAAEFIDELPDGLDTKIGENGVGLSEGQIQRVSVARAVLSGAPILLLDEATSALDEPTEAKMLSRIKALDNRTCIIVTHKRAALDICNRHFAIKDKKIVDADAVGSECAQSMII